MHEYGHGLYSHQQPKHLERLPTGGRARSASTSRRAGSGRTSSAAASRSGASSIRACRRRTRSSSAASTSTGSTPASTRVKPGLIRIQADEVTLRDARDAPLRARAGHRRGPRRAAAICRSGGTRRCGSTSASRCPTTAHGVLQDVHWSGGTIGYFSTYLIGTVASVQIWQAAQRDLPELEEQVGRGEFAPLREWLGEHIHIARAQVLAAGDAAPRDRLDDRRRSRISTTSAERTHRSRRAG